MLNLVNVSLAGGQPPRVLKSFGKGTASSESTFGSDAEYLSSISQLKIPKSN